MIVSFMASDRQLLTSFTRSVLKQFWLQLFREERIAKALIHENVVEIAMCEAGA